MECECTITDDPKVPGRICKLHFGYIERAVAAEREACARIAETAGCGTEGCTDCYGGGIAAMIRARSNNSN